MGDMTVDELKDKKLWFLWSAKPSMNITGTFTPLVRIEETIVPD